MSLEDLKRKMRDEAAKVGTSFWNPKVGDGMFGEITEQKEVNGDMRYVFHDILRDQYFILPNHGHLNKQLGEDAIGSRLYIELSAESELKSGPGKGKMGKLYFVSKLNEDDWKEVIAHKGSEPKIVVNPPQEDAEDDFDFKED